MHTRDEYIAKLNRIICDVDTSIQLYDAIRPLIDDDIDEAIYGSKDPL